MEDKLYDTSRKVDLNVMNNGRYATKMPELT